MKKLLALVLALVMTLGLATVSASAADFKDQDKIQHEQAVNTLVSLGVIAGMPDGTFQPEGTVTRAQMAKMITIIALGDVSVSAFEGTQTDLKDINGHWAEAYIKYCYSQGIIAGRGNGKFDPDDLVTTTEAAKMCLTVIGYNSDVQGYTGENWKINVTRDAQTSGFFAELGGLTADKKLTRDEAAQMILNAADADLIIKTPTLNVNTGTIQYQYSPDDVNHTDLLNKTFKAYTYEGYFTNFSYNKVDKKWTYTVNTNAITDDDSTLGANTAGFTTAIPAVTANQHTPGSALGVNASDPGDFDFPSTEDYTEMYGMRVKVLYSQDNNDSIANVLGMYTTKTKVVSNNLAAHLPAALTAAAAGEKEIELDDVKVALTARASETPIYEFAYNRTIGSVNGTAQDNVISPASLGLAGYVASNTATGNDAIGTYVMKTIDVTGDNKGDLIMVYPALVGEVNYVGANQFTLTTVAARGNLGPDFGATVAGSYKLADVNAYSGIAKDDYVLYTPAGYTADNTAKFEKLEIQTAKVDAIKSRDNKAQIGGNWLDTSALPAVDVPEVGDTVEFRVVNGVLVYCDGSEKNGAGQLGLVTAAAPAKAGVNKLQEITILKSDDTKQTAQVKKINGVVQTAPAGTLVLVGEFYDWKLNSDGQFELTTLDDAQYFTAGTAALAAGQIASDFDQVNTFAAGAAYGGTKVFDVETNALAPATGATRTAKDGGAYGASTGNTAFVPAGAKTDASIGDFTVIADDAVVWVYDDGGTAGTPANDDAFVTNGKALKADDSGTTKVLFAGGIKNSKSGYYEVKAAYVYTSGLTTKSNYGFVLSAPVKSADGNKEYVTVKFWDGSKVQELRTKSDVKTANENLKGGTGAYSLSTRSVFTYSVDSNGYLTDVTNLRLVDVAIAQYSGNNITFDGVVYWDNNGSIQVRDGSPIMGAAYIVTKDTTVFYVNSKEPEGVASGSIAIAAQTNIASASLDSDGTKAPIGTGVTYFLSNAFYLDDDADGELEILVVDVAGNMKNVE